MAQLDQNLCFKKKFKINTISKKQKTRPRKLKQGEDICVELSSPTPSDPNQQNTHTQSSCFHFYPSATPNIIPIFIASLSPDHFLCFLLGFLGFLYSLNFSRKYHSNKPFTISCLPVLLFFPPLSKTSFSLPVLIISIYLSLRLSAIFIS